MSLYTSLQAKPTQEDLTALAKVLSVQKSLLTNAMPDSWYPERGLGVSGVLQGAGFACTRLTSVHLRRQHLARSVSFVSANATNGPCPLQALRSSLGLRLSTESDHSRESESDSAPSGESRRTQSAQSGRNQASAHGSHADSAPLALPIVWRWHHERH